MYIFEYNRVLYKYMETFRRKNVLNLLVTRQESIRSDLGQGGINFGQRQPVSERSATYLGVIPASGNSYT